MEWNNFKSSCVRKLNLLPKEPCELGEKSTKNKELCPWYINDKKHHFCFWKYVNDVADDKGQIPILCYREIGKFLDLSSSTVGITVRDCIEKLKKHPQCEEIKDFLTEVAKEEDNVDVSVLKEVQKTED